MRVVQEPTLQASRVPSDDAFDPVVEVEGLRVEFGGRRWPSRPPFVAVDDVTLAVRRGQTVGLVGESGSGKSTTASAIAQLVPVAAGSVRLLGRELSTLTARQMRALRGDIQIIFQDPHAALDPRQSVQSGLRELRRFHPHRTEWVSDQDLVESVGLTADILPRLAHEISGGQAQRVCVARALLLRPRVLIADEPTSALDVSVQAHVLELLDRLRDEHDIAILFISHDLSVVRAVCDEVHVMRHGRIVESGPTEAVLTAPQHDYTRALIGALPGVDDGTPNPELGDAAGAGGRR